jgi:hypothetical protein
MGRDAELKTLRKQLRNIAQEMLPTILTQEVVEAIGKTLSQKLETRVDAIDKHIKTALNAIDERSKEVQSFIVRNVGVPASPTATASAEPPPVAAEVAAAPSETEST